MLSLFFATALDLAPLAPADLRADVALMRRAYERVHPGLYRYTSKRDIDAAFGRLETFSAQPHDVLAFYAAISQTIAAIRCDHSKAEMPPAVEQYREREPTYFPFRFRLFDGRMVVVSADPTQPQLAAGQEIVSIDGRPVADVVAALAPDVSYDGNTSYVVPFKLEADSDLDGSDFETFYPAHFGFAAMHDLAIRSAGGEAKAIRVTPISVAAWRALPWPAIPYHSDLVNGTTWSLLDAKTAYLRVDSFVKYRRPVDAMTYYDAFFKSIDASGASRLIVDLRWNGGGSTDATIALARFLMNERFVWNAPMVVKTLDFGDLPDYAQTWGDQNAFFHPDPAAYERRPDGMYQMIPGASKNDEDGEMQPLDPSPDRFPGRVVVLTGPRNASGSTMLVSKLHDEGRATLVGEATGGSAVGPTAGFILFLRLPNSQIVVRVPDMWNRMAVTHAREGYGVDPDVRVTATRDDVLAGRDPVLGAARAL
jgi:hypothetical protein